MLTYKEASLILGTKQFKKLRGNTYLTRKDNAFIIKFHNTDIVFIHPDNTYTLYNGGHRTKTTKERLSRYSPVKVYQEDWEWFVNKIPFFNGIKVNAKGEVVK